MRNVYAVCMSTLLYCQNESIGCSLSYYRDCRPNSVTRLRRQTARHVGGVVYSGCLMSQLLSRLHDQGCNYCHCSHKPCRLSTFSILLQHLRAEMVGASWKALNILRNTDRPDTASPKFHSLGATATNKIP
jgi:hypothetical protein